jgi:hypothetical protein
MLAGVLGLE